LFLYHYVFLHPFDISQNDAEILEKQWQEMQWRHKEKQRQSYIGLSTWLRRLGGKQRRRPRRKLRGRELQRRRREREGWWSTSNSSEMRC